jgi:GNAT superfamily N-acetyltransferase
VRVEIHPFTDDDVPAAGRLLADRHRRHLRTQPLLSSRFMNAEAGAQAVAAALAQEGSAGAFATRGGQPMGYLLGAPKSSPVWGANVWVESAGQAVTEAEVMRDLYAVAATEWMARDLRAQYVIVPSGDPDLLDAWYRLGFGQQHAHAIREPLLSVPAGEHITVRAARRDDIAMLARLDLVLPEHQGLAPTFSPGVTGTYAEARAEWEESFDDREFQVLVAEHDGHVVGSAVGCALEKSNSHTGPARPDNAGFLGFAAVLPQARGLGAGRALGKAVLGWCGEAGFDSVVTDWRVTNLHSSRTWHALGWRPTFLRLHRLIGY